MSDSVIDAVIANWNNDDRPYVRWGKLASSVLGIISLGWFYGAIGFVQGIGSGVASGLARAESWLSNELITALFGGVIGGIKTGWAEYLSLVENTGPVAPVFAIVAGGVVVIVFVATLQRAASIVLGVI